MAERNISTTLKKRLINNEPFIYAHLIKYERPSAATVHAKHSTDAVRYAYLTDAPINISFDDGSYATDGTTANGSQNYIADKILSVGNYQETNQAKATGMTLKLGANSINNSVTASMTMTTSEITATSINFINEGFRDGDKVLITGGTNNNHEVRITGIKGDGTILVVSNIDSTLATQSSATSTTIQVVSDELKGPLVERNDSGNLKSYHNRDVFIYKAFLDPDDYTIIGAPVLVFKGIIASSSIIDNPSKDIEVQWKLTSHWGDFYAVNGRMTNDAVHRALDNNGEPDPQMALKEIYAGDLGFMHAETTVNILSTYIALEKQPELKKKKKFFGLIKKYDMVWKDVEVERTTDLNWALESKFIPIVYGVDRIAGLPIFVDTLSNNSSKVYMVYALSEGEIGGLFDLYIDDHPLICQTNEDADARTASSDGVDVVCRGRADRGTVLAGKIVSGPNAPSPTNEEEPDWVYHYSPGGGDKIPARVRANYIVNTGLRNAGVTSTNSKGVIHEETISMTAPNDMHFDVHVGKTEQRASNTLTEIANGTKFKRQSDYWDSTTDYWGPNHTLADTAYVVMECTIAEDAETVPDVEYVVRGKFVESYNYDFSYYHNPLTTYTSEAASNFKVGDTVDLKKTSDDSVINNDVYIIDKWTMVGPDGVEETRFRFSDSPNLGYTGGVPAVTDFYMQDADGTNKWHMITYNHVFTSGTTGASTKLSATIGSSSNVPTITFGSAPDWIREDGTNDTFPKFDNHSGYLPVRIINSGGDYTNTTFPMTITSSTVLTFTGASDENLVTGTKDVIRTDTIRLAASTNVADNFYNGMTVELTIKDANNNWTKHTRKIVDYDQSTDLAQVDRPWDAGFEPGVDSNSTYTYKILSPGDRRVSINPVIQLLDYTTSSTYGMRLDVEEDIALAEWTLAARTCDDKGSQTITVKANSVDTADGDMYVLTSDGTASGDIIAMGQVVNHGAAGDTTIELQECYGKFSKDYMKSRHSYVVGDIVNDSTGYFRVTSAGTNDKGPTEGGASGYSTVITTDGYPIYKLSQSGGSTTIESSTGKLYALKQDTIGTTSYENAVEYSLYNSDFVKYWRYLGWEHHDQRWVTRHQFCGVVDTATSVFDNVNSFLKQMNGMLSYENGEYVLRIATTSTAIASDIEASSGTGYSIGSEKNVRYITSDDIIGNISLTDPGPKKSYNTMTSTIADPGSRFKGKQVSFFDSNYLKTDKNVIKSGTHSQPAVASYFNARINVENALRKSRFGMKISFKLGPKALLLLAGETIAITHDKFDWTAKKFRITTINYNKDCTASISAEEYDDSFYTISTPKLPSVINEDITQPIPPIIGAPTALSAVSDTVGTIDLSWTSGNQSTSANDTEIWVHTSNDRSAAKLRATIPDNPDFNDGTNDGAGNRLVKYTDTIGYDGRAKYYWIRHKWKNRLGRVKYSGWFPTSATGGVNATSVLAATYRNVTLQSDKQIFTSEDGTLDASTIKITPTITNLDNNIAWTTAGDDNNSIDLHTAASGGSTTTSGRVPVYLRHSSLNNNTSVSVTATISENSVTYAETITFPVIDSTATSAKTVRIRASGLVFLDDNDDTSSTPDSPDWIKFEAVKQNTSAASSWSTSPSVDLYAATTGGSATTSGDTVYMRKADYAANTNVLVTLTCDSITDTTSIVRLKRNSGSIQAVLTNPNHVLPADPDGAVSNTQAAGSGTQIRVYEGITALNFVTGTPGAGEWAVSVGNTADIVEGGVTDSGSYATIADHTSVTTGTDTYTITYTITGKTLDGTSFTSFTKDQTLTKAKKGVTGANAKLVVVTPSHHIMLKEYEPGSTNYIPSSITVRAENANTTADGAWSTSAGTLTNIVNTHTNASCTVTGANFVDGMTVTYTAHSDDASISDSTTLELVERQSGSITPILTNEAHVLAASAAGAVSDYAGSGTEIRVYEGSRLLDYDATGTANGHWKVVISDTNNITEGSLSSGGSGNNRYAIVGNHSGVATGTDSYIITYTISGKTLKGDSFSHVKTQSITKSKTGQTGDDGDNTAIVTLYQRTSSGSSAPAVINDNSTYTFATGVLSNTNGLDSWTQTVPSGAAQYLWTTSATAIGANGAATATVATGDWATPTVQSEATQPRTFTKTVFYDSWTSGTVSAPTSTGFDWDDMELDGLSTGWSNSLATLPFAYCVYDATEDTYGGTTTVTFQPVGYLNEIVYQVPTSLQNDQINLTASGGTVTLNNAASSNNTLDKNSIALGNVADVDQRNASNITSGTLAEARAAAALKNSQITTNANGTLNYDGTSATAPSLASITGIVGKAGGGLGEDISSATGVLRMASGTLNKDSTLSTTYTDATDNGTTINTSGNISGTVDIASGGSITVGNITIDGTNNRILITD